MNPLNTIIRLATLFSAMNGLTMVPAVAETSATKPNILLMVADDLGYSDLGCYGGEIDSPNLNQLAAGGMRLTRFYNTGRCCPSRASILTGQYPHRVGLGHMTQDIGRPGYRGKVSDDAITIAQLLAASNYRSFIAGKWHLGTPDPTQHGFEEFYGTLVSAKRFFDPTHFVRLPENRLCRVYEPNAFYGTDAVTDHALDFLKLAEQTPDRPWFLYLAYNAPHFPLQAKKTDIAKYAGRYHVGWDAIRQTRLQRMKTLRIVPETTVLTPRSPYWDYGEVNSGVNPAWESIGEDRKLDLARRMAIYAAMVDSMDQNIGRVVGHLRVSGDFDNTLIIFLSDNGACAEWDPWGFDISSSPNNILHRGDEIESMGEPDTFHSAGSGWANASNTPWRLYKHFNHEGGINSPCIFHWSGHIPQAGRLDHTPTHLIDLLPTIADASSTEYKGSIDLPGRSLVPLLSGMEIAPRDAASQDAALRYLYFEHEGNRAVTGDRWKIVASKDRPWELYDMTADRTELNNLADQDPQRVETLSRLWDQWAAENQVTPLPDDYQVPYLKPRKLSSTDVQVSGSTARVIIQEQSEAELRIDLDKP